MVNIYPLEWCFFAGSCAGMVAHGVLFLVKLRDVMAVREAKKNGPVLFIATDKIRQQGFMLAVFSGMLMLAISGLFTGFILTPQMKNFLVGGTIFGFASVVDVGFTFWRRRLLQDMVTAYGGIAGGRRKTDPPRV
jgi:hypothetical protein